MACSSDLSEMVRQSSDEIQEMFCEPCKIHDNIDVTATGFCVNCQEYVCDTCRRYDRRQNQGHQHLDKDNMPQDFCFEKCSVHADKMIKFICVKCNKLICTTCKDNDHQHCGGVQHLPSYLKDFENNKAFTQLLGNISDLLQKTKVTQQKLGKTILQIGRQVENSTSAVNNYSESIQKDLHKQEQELIEEFKKQKEKLIQKTNLKIERLRERNLEKVTMIKEQHRVLEEAKDDILQQVSAKRKSEKKNLKACLKKNEAIAADIDSLQTDLEQKQKPGWGYKLFSALKPAQDQVQQWETDLRIIEEKTEVNEYMVEPTEFYDRQRTLNAPGNVFLLKEIWRSNRTRTFTFEFDIQTATKSKCTSLCLLSEVMLIMTDNVNRCLYSSSVDLDNRQRMMMPLLENMQSQPWQAAKARTNAAVVAFPSQGVVLAMKVVESTDGGVGSNRQVVSGEIVGKREAGKGCMGLTYCKDKLITSYTKPATVLILDMAGNILRSIENDSKGFPLFKAPKYLAISPDSETIYVSDSDEHTVTSMTLDGKVKAVYKDSELRKPAQLAVDRSGAVFVCGEDSNNIHHLTSDLERVKILLDKSHGIEKPVGLAYCNRQDRLYVGVTKPPIIKVFKLSPE